MTNIIKIKNSQTANNAPELIAGEIAINEADEYLFWRDSVGALRTLDLSGSTTSYPWSLQSGGTYSGNTYDPTTQSPVTQGFTWKDDGSLYLLVDSGSDTVYSYDVTTNWDVSTSSYSGDSLDISTEDVTPLDLTFGKDGERLYIVGSTNNKIFQYNLSTPYDITTASYASKSLSIGGQDTVPHGLDISEDGSKIYMVGNANDRVYEYDLSTAWELDSGSYSGNSFLLTGEATNNLAIRFDPTGTKMFVIGDVPNYRVHEYTLGTAWSLGGTVTYSGNFVDVSTQTTDQLRGLDMGRSGTKLYVAATDIVSTDIFEYDL